MHISHFTTANLASTLGIIPEAPVTTAVVRLRPRCQICLDARAQYDIRSYGGRWTYVCESCRFDEQGTTEPRLGTGIGQVLVEEPVSPTSP
jgi:hypothetical protein